MSKRVLNYINRKMEDKRNSFTDLEELEPDLNSEVSSLLGLVRGSVKSPCKAEPHANKYASIAMLKGLKVQLEDHFKTEMKLCLDQLRRVEERCDVILIKIPVLEDHTGKIESLRRELEYEVRKRREKEQHYTDSVEKLMEEIVQVNAKVIMLEGRIVDMEINQARDSPPIHNEATRNLDMSTSEWPSGSESGMFGSLTSNNLNVIGHDLIHPTRPTPTETFPGNHNEIDENFESNHEPSNQVRPTPNVKEASTPHKFICLCGATFDFNKVGDIGKHTSQTCAIIAKGFSREVFRQPERPRKQVRFLDSTDGRSNSTKTEGQLNVMQSDEENNTIHGKVTASEPGFHIPLLCLCGLKFPSDHAFLEHVRKHQASISPAFRESSIVKFFRKKSVNAEFISCEFCGKEFHSDSYLKAHLQRVHSHKPTATNQTVLMSLPLNELTMDQRHDEDPFQPLSCLCGIQCRDSSALHSHITGMKSRQNQKLSVSPSNAYAAAKSNSDHRIPIQPSHAITKKVLPTTEPCNQPRGDSAQLHGKGWRQLDKEGNVKCHYCLCATKYRSEDDLINHIRDVTS